MTKSCSFTWAGHLEGTATTHASCWGGEEEKVGVSGRISGGGGGGGERVLCGGLKRTRIGEDVKKIWITFSFSLSLSLFFFSLSLFLSLSLSLSLLYLNPFYLFFLLNRFLTFFPSFFSSFLSPSLPPFHFAFLPSILLSLSPSLPPFPPSLTCHFVSTVSDG